MGARPMKVSRLILWAAVAGCGSVSVVGTPADGGIKEKDAATDAASDAGTVDTGAVDTGAGQTGLGCGTSFAAYCCAGDILCAGNWNSAINCTSFLSDIVPDCDGFHAARWIDSWYYLYTASTGAPAAILRQDWSCAVGPPVFDIDAGCLSFWASTPITSNIPCFDGGRQFFSCDAAAPPDDGSLASDALSGSDAYPSD
jgi:hypothetical protein